MNSPMQKSRRGYGFIDGPIENGNVRQAGGSAECMSYLLRRIKEQEDRERIMMTEIETLRLKNSLLRVESEKKDESIENLRGRLHNCHCGSRNRSHHDDNQQHEIGILAFN